MTEKALLPSDDRSNRMERTSESEDRVGIEFVGNERLLCFVCEKTEFVIDSLFYWKSVYFSK